MSFAELSVARYSLRKFSTQPVEAEKLDLILEAARVAPTAHNDQPQRIFVFQSPEALEAVRACTPCHFNAPMVLAVGYEADSAWVREVDGKNYGEYDTATVAAHIALQAADLGLGTTLVAMFDPEQLKAAFPQIGTATVTILIPLGYPREDAKPSRLHADRKPIEELVKYL